MTEPNYEARILVVDDEPMNVLVISELLKINKISYESSNSGLKALRMIKDRIKNRVPLYQLIFMDYSMPILDGLQTSVKIKKLCNKKGIDSPKIVCLTAYTEPQFRQKALDAGMDDFMTKPITEEKLLASIDFF